MDKKSTIAILVVVVILIAAVAAIVAVDNKEDNGEPKAMADAQLKVYGNINGDRYLDDRDANLIQSLIDDGKTAEEYPAADANMDGKLDSADVDLVKAVARGESARIWHVNYHDTDKDGVMDEETVQTSFPITSAIMTGSANSFILVMSLGIKDEIKGASYSNTNDKALLGDYYLDESKVERIGTSSTSIKFEDGKVGSSNIIAEKGVTALLTDWNKSYITNESDFRKANVDVVRVAAATVDIESMTHSIMLLGLLFQKVDAADKLLDMNIDIFDKVDAVVKANEGSKTTFVASSTTGSISSDSSDYTQLCERAGGQFAIADPSVFNGLASIKIADHPEIYTNNIDRIIHLRTAITYDQTPESIKSSWDSYVKPFADAPDTTKQVMVSGSIPVAIRCAYVCAALYSDSFSLDEVTAMHQDYIDNFYQGKTFDLSEMKFLVTAEDFS